MDKTAAKQTALDMMDFIARSPSSFHAAANLEAMLSEAGFEVLSEHDCWDLKRGGSYCVTRNGSAILAFRIPEQPQGGFLIASAHSDSPTFRLKRSPELKDRNYLRLNVEKYGGSIFSPWLDRPLSVAGRLMVQEGDQVTTRLVDIGRDLVLIPNMAIHMQREMNDGIALNPQVDMLPLLGQSEETGTMDRLAAEAAGVAPEAVLDSDLYLYLREHGHVWGAEEEFISSPRLDDLQCAWSAVQALIKARNPRCIAVAAIFDNEEVGSGTKQGADSSFLQDVLTRIAGSLGWDAQRYQAAVASSLMLSADNGHARHPNHPEKADDVNYPTLNGGVVVKYSANQKYCTDAVSGGLFRLICQRAGVPVQTYHNRSDVLGGSTLGNISTTHVSLNTVDIGLAELAMHSPMETGGVLDTAWMQQAMQATFESRLLCEGPGKYRVD